MLERNDSDQSTHASLWRERVTTTPLVRAMLSAATTTTTTTTAPKNNRRRRRRLENIETSARLLLVVCSFLKSYWTNTLAWKGCLVRKVRVFEKSFWKKKALFGHFVFHDVRKKPNENTQDDTNARQRTTRARTQTTLKRERSWARTTTEKETS